MLEHAVWGDSPPDSDALRTHIHALRQAIYCCRKGGTVSVPGVYGGLLDKLPFGSAFSKGLTLRMGQTHVHRYMQPLIEKIQGCDVVLGSRYLKGITVVDWPIERLLLSYFGNWYVRRVTGLPMRDTTGGFKCWRRSALEAVNVAGVRSNGYAFQIEMTYRAWRRGLRIQEIPIIFMDRTVGDSKMTKRISLEALWIAWYLRAAHLFGRL